MRQFKNIFCVFLMLSVSLTGCGRSTSKHPFNGRSFPTWCNDEGTVGQADFYPIYIDYSPENLEAVSRQFCGGGTRLPNRVFRRDVNKESVEVAFFSTLDRANTFREIISSKFSSAEVGKSITIEPTAKDAIDIGTSRHFEKYQVSSVLFPQLDKSKINQLRKLVGKKSKKIESFQVALPTYIPDGFYLENLAISDLNSIDYVITYTSRLRNPTSCFLLSGHSGGTGGTLTYFTSLNINSSALGNVRLEYSSFDRSGDISNLYFDKSIGDVNLSSKHYYYMGSCKDGISLSEARKVIESVRFLKP